MAINQITTSNTFGQWVSTTQSLITKYNTLETDIEAINTSATNVTANTNLFLNTYSTLINTALAYSNVAPATYNISNAASNTANLALTTANLALNISQQAANTAYIAIIDTVDANTYYPTFLNKITGNVANAYVSSTKLYYNPSTGTLSSTNLTSLSDVNRKINISSIPNPLEIISQIRGVSFNWKDTGEKSMGVIAQEIEAILPEVVSTNEAGEKSVSYGNIVGLLIECVKELKKEIEELKAKVQ